MNHYYDLNPMGFNGECPTSGFPENGHDEPEEYPEGVDEFSARVQALSEADLKERAKKQQQKESI